ncbi:hypothetical protein NQL31_003398 [Lotmaria passim]
MVRPSATKRVEQRVRVSVRVRPLNPREQKAAEGSLITVTANQQTSVVSVTPVSSIGNDATEDGVVGNRRSTQDFQFDHVFWSVESAGAESRGRVAHHRDRQPANFGRIRDPCEQHRQRRDGGRRGGEPQVYTGLPVRPRVLVGGQARCVRRQPRDAGGRVRDDRAAAGAARLRRLQLVPVRVRADGQREDVHDDGRGRERAWRRGQRRDAAHLPGDLRAQGERGGGGALAVVGGARVRGGVQRARVGPAGEAEEGREGCGRGVRGGARAPEPRRVPGGPAPRGGEEPGRRCEADRAWQRCAAHCCDENERPEQSQPRDHNAAAAGGADDDDEGGGDDQDRGQEQPDEPGGPCGV